jgi:hypothetical protein
MIRPGGAGTDPGRFSPFGSPPAARSAVAQPFNHLTKECQ